MNRNLKHVLQEALPWQTAPTITECGRERTPTIATITWGEFLKLVRNAPPATVRYLQSGLAPDGTRLAGDLCHRCTVLSFQIARRNAHWDSNPAAAMMRWLDPVQRTSTTLAARDANAQLLALAELATQYPEEFAALRDRNAALLALKRPGWPT